MKIALLAFFFFCCVCAVFSLDVFVSNATIGSEIYVLVVESEGNLYEGAGIATSPSGEEIVFEIVGGQAKIPASEVGEWKISVGGAHRAAYVEDEAAKTHEIEEGDGIFLGAFFGIALFFCVAIGAAVFLLRKVHRHMLEGDEAEEPKKRKLKKGNV